MNNAFEYYLNRFNIKLTYLYLHIKYYPAPKSLSYFWSFGSLLATCLAIQILSGFFLSIYYKPTYLEAFDSVELTIMRDIPFGWLLRYIHANIASFFFMAAYIHIGKAIYYQGYIKKKVWFSGLILFIALMAEAFTGYVLPWGQMSFWAATVITNFFSIVPLVGKYVVELLWGGFTVCEQTLKRFFSIHFLLGIVIGALTIVHIIVLHDYGSSSAKNDNINNKVNFIPVFGEEILFSFFVFLTIASYIILFRPLLFMHPANFEQANPLVTPPHIVPEWYFLPFYTILRVTPGKEAGILLMGGSIVILFFVPFFSPNLFKTQILNLFFFSFIADVLILGYLGGCPAEPLYILYGRIATTYYFFFLTILMPLHKMLSLNSLKNKLDFINNVRNEILFWKKF